MEQSISTLLWQAADMANLPGFTGTYRELGGGELNDSYVLQLESGFVVVRIAKYADQATLIQEAQALSLLDLPGVPKVYFFDAQTRLDNRLWVVESYVEGVGTDRLTNGQLHNLGMLLAQIHRTKSPDASPINAWQSFLSDMKAFGSEDQLLNHHWERLRNLVTKTKQYVFAMQPYFNGIQKALIHGDASPSNILVLNDGVSLIDWEFAGFRDPMREFATLYYEDMEYNEGKWRMHITPEEKDVLFQAYLQAGGQLDEQRIKVWMIIDKLGVAVFLYWRMVISGRPMSDDQLQQYQLDLMNVINSLESEYLAMHL